MTEPEPWQTSHWRRVGVTTAVCVVGLLVSWLETRHADSFKLQERWVAVGIAATGVGALGFVDWLASGFRRTNDLQARLEAAVADTLTSAEDRAAAGYVLPTVPTRRPVKR